jgi:predicted metal-dependent phosphoesterase TrpH
MPFANLAGVKIDLHLHTDYSVDGWSSPEDMVRTAMARGLDRIAITDHDTIEGALMAHGSWPDRVIVGEEITCQCGTHLIGLFLTNHVPTGIQIEEAAERIRSQGGLVYGPHPYAYLSKPVRRANRVAAVSDLVEIFNSRAFLPAWNSKASALARDRELPAAASSDAHFHRELRRAYTEVPEFKTANEFRDSLAKAQPKGIRTGSPWLHVASALAARTRWLRPGVGGFSTPLSAGAE